jgi:SAM-dependent methyltransferase
VPTEPPAWSEAFAHPAQPLVLDIGCGYGRFLLALRWVPCCSAGQGRAWAAPAQLRRCSSSSL